MKFTIWDISLCFYSRLICLILNVLIFSLEGKTYSYEITILCVCVCVCVSPFNFWTNGPIFTKLCMNVMPLEDTPTAKLFISYRQ
jgi:hypothetical protein